MHYLDFVYINDKDVSWEHSDNWTKVLKSEYYKIARNIKVIPHTFREVYRSPIFGRHIIYYFDKPLDGLVIIPSRALDRTKASAIRVGAFERLDLSAIAHEIGIKYDPKKVFSIDRRNISDEN